MRIKMPAVRIAQADADSGEGDPSQDLLTCGSCQKPFALSDIVRFIQHKVLVCNKENYAQCFKQETTGDQDSDDGRPMSLVNSRRPSISAPMSSRKASGSGSTRVQSEPLASPALLAPADLLPDGAASSTPKNNDRSTPKRAASSSPLTCSLEDDVKPSNSIKQERMDTSSSPENASPFLPCKKTRTEVADAESNTTHSEPSNYVCSTCKLRLHSAWRLVQHVQHAHGVKIYVESSPGGHSNANQSNSSGHSSQSKAHHSTSANNHSTSSSCSSSSSGCSSGNLAPPGLRHHPLLPPPDMHTPFGVSGLLRMPLPTSMAPMGHPVPQAPLFVRPNHHDHHFRMEQLVSEQFRHHGLNLAAAAAAAVAANSLPSHQPFPSPAERAPLIPTSTPSRERSLPPVSQPLSLEPQLDFYSQRLRQLAGTTSPGAATGNSSSPSPRKHSPPFASPSPSHLPPTPLTNNNNNNHNNNHTHSRAQSLTPPEKQSELSVAPSNLPAITTTPRSASTPPSKQALCLTGAANDAVHSCEYCGKKFRFQSNLIVHRRAHTGERPYKCSVCDHACTQSSKLKRHMKIHRTPEDRTSNAGSVETLDGDDSNDELEDEEEDDEEDLEGEDYMEDEAEDLSIPSHNNPALKMSYSAPPASASLVGELMDKFGLSNIAQYSEAYKQALQESGNALKLTSKDRDNNNGSGALPAPGPMDKLNGLPAALRLREEFAKNMLQPPQVPPPPHHLFNPFENPFEASKRLKLDMERGDAAWWLPGLHGPRSGEGMFGEMKIKGPGPSAGLLQSPLLKKESRRNDTCEYCGKVFKNCSNLTVHRRSHTGEKPYKCELCSYACAQSSKLTRHMKTHGRLGKDVYRCRFCEMPFSVPSTLEKHMRKCVVNQGKAHLLPPLPMLSGDEDFSTSSVASKEAA